MALKVRTSVDGSGFAAGLSKMEEDAANFGRNLSGKIGGNLSQGIMSIVPGLTGAISGIFAADSIKASLSDFAKKGEDIEFGAIRLNVDPVTYQKIDNVMREIGQSADSASTAFDKLAVGLTKIEAGGPAALKLREAFAELGVTTQDLATKDPSALFLETAQRLKDTAPTIEQIAALREIYGRGGDNLLPAFKLGFDGNVANAGIINDRDLSALKNYNAESRETRSVWAGTLNTTKAFFIAAGAGFMSLLQPGKLLTSVLTPEDHGEAKMMESKAKKLQADLDAKATAKARNDALQEQNRKDGAKFDAEDKKKAATIDKETEALKERNREAAMSPEAKRLEILQQIKTMEGELKYGGGDLSKADEAAMRKKIEEAKGALAELERPKDRPEHRKAMHNLGNTAIGGIMLGRDAAAEMARKSAHHLESIDRKTAPVRPGGNRPRGDYS